MPVGGIHYQRDSTGAPLTILGDFEEVQAAVSNLLDNAVKYSGGNVAVTVKAARGEGGFVSVRVTDQGPGIPQTELKRIFKRFYRVPGPLATRVKGTGLGLFIVRSVAQAAWRARVGGERRAGTGQHVCPAVSDCDK